MKDIYNIIINHGFEFCPSIESVYDENLYFHESYENAARCLREIIIASDEYCKKTNGNCIYNNSIFIGDILSYPNNIMAFCADRGRGKTTAMRSFAEAIRGINCARIKCADLEMVKRFWGFNENCLNPNFSVLNIIDPTLMNDQDSIMKTILSRMMFDVSAKWESLNANERKDYTCRKQKLLDSFQQCYSDIRVLYSDSWKDIEYDDLEKLREYGDSTNIKINLYKLVREYLDFMNETCNSDSNMLVIQIDDADMNIKASYRIVEEVKKYLCIPQVVVLIAVSPTQLGRTIEQHFIEEYEIGLKYKGNIDIQQCHMIAEKYIEKFMPAHRQIFLPELILETRGYFKNIVIKYYNDSEHLNNVLYENENRVTYQEQLALFLRNKTGIVIAPSNAYLHNFLPSTMRELTHFLAYFNQCLEKNEDVYLQISRRILTKDYSEKDVAEWVNTQKKLLTVVEEYLINIWAQTNLPYQGSYILKQLQNTNGFDKNRSILVHLIRYYDLETKHNDIRDKRDTNYTDRNFIDTCIERGVNLPIEEIKQYINTESYQESNYEVKLQQGLTYADIYEALNVLTDLSGSRQYKFAYSIRLYYSIFIQHLFLDAAKKANSTTKDEEILLSTYSRSINPINLFIGDVFYRKYPKRSASFASNLSVEYETSDKIPFSKYEINKTRMIEILQLYAGSKKGDVSRVSPRLLRTLSIWCRIEVPFSMGTVMACPENRFFYTKTDIDDKLYFNVFYILMHKIDEMMTSIKKPSAQDGLCLSAVIMFMSNWDIQYELHKKLRDEPIKNTNLFRIIKILYDMYMTDILLIYGTTDIADIDNLFGLPTNSFELLREQNSTIINEINEILFAKDTVDGSDIHLVELPANMERQDDKTPVKENGPRESAFDNNNKIMTEFLAGMKESESAEAIYIIQCCNDYLLYLYTSNMQVRLDRFANYINDQENYENKSLAQIDWSKTDNDNRNTWTIFIQESGFLKFLVRYKDAIIKKDTTNENATNEDTTNEDTTKKDTIDENATKKDTIDENTVNEHIKALPNYDMWIPLPTTNAKECYDNINMYAEVLTLINEALVGR